jgi:hypothetical protein
MPEFKINAARAKTPYEAVTAILTHHQMLGDPFVVQVVDENDPNVLLHKACVLGREDGANSDPVIVSQYIDHVADDGMDETFFVGSASGIIGTMIVLYDAEQNVKEVFYSTNLVRFGSDGELHPGIAH